MPKSIKCTVFYYHDFWNQTGADATNNLIHALKNLSLIGAVFMIAGYRQVSHTAGPAYAAMSR